MTDADPRDNVFGDVGDVGAVVEAFEQLLTTTPPPAPSDLELQAADLKPGMVMAQDLLSPQGTLLLAAGFVFDTGVINTIRDLVAREGLGIVFRIRDSRPQPAIALT